MNVDPKQINNLIKIFCELDEEYRGKALMEMNIEKGMASYPDLIDIYTKYYSDWWDSGFSTLGRRISDRIYLWAAGFQMAWKQLSENINK